MDLLEEQQHTLEMSRMINQSTIDTLRQMRMGAMAQSLEEQLLDHELMGS